MKKFLKKNGGYLITATIIIFVLGNKAWVKILGETLYYALLMATFAWIIASFFIYPFINYFFDKKQDSDEAKNLKTSQFKDSISSELKELHKLYDKGSLDEEEFKKAKEKILNN